MVDCHGILRDVDLQADRAYQHDKTVRLRLRISEFVREEAYVLREIKVLQIPAKAAMKNYISSFQGSFSFQKIKW